MSLLILASQSPRRRELLAEAGYSFHVVPPRPDAESPPQRGEAAVDYVRRSAYEKARDVAQRTPAGTVIGCDTVAACEGQILGKPADRADAEQMLRRLRGRKHQVLSGLCLWHRPSDSIVLEVAETQLFMEPISDEQLDEYLDSGAWQGKAGAFGLQDRLGWIRVLDGSPSNVVGLPLELLAEMLAKAEGNHE